jgi:hypothetical protein
VHEKGRKLLGHRNERFDDAVDDWAYPVDEKQRTIRGLREGKVRSFRLFSTDFYARVVVLDFKQKARGQVKIDWTSVGDNMLVWLRTESEICVAVGLDISPYSACA